MTTTSKAPLLARPTALLAELRVDRAIWIDGQGRGANSGATFVVEDPANEEGIATVADGHVLEAHAAVDAAARAQLSWTHSAPRLRSEVLRRAFDLMHEDHEQLARLIAWENGKALDDARGEVAYAAEFFRWFSEEAVRVGGRFGDSPAGDSRTVVTHRPVGIAALITPWNFPAAMATRKIGPALAAGCAVLLKPAAETPLTALAIAQILQRAGVPDGVVNVVPTTSPEAVVGTWLNDPRVRKISFTGSTAVGKTLLHHAADRVMNSSMELGGNAPFVVAEDADVTKSVAGALVAKFRNGGQACTAANRFYVHTRVHDEFVARFGSAVEALRVGSAFQEGTQIGPLVSAKALAGVSNLVRSAVAGGAVISHQGNAPSAGHYYPPTVLTGVAATADILQEEIFGPVAPIVAWDDEAELIEWTNATPYGLAAYVFSGDLDHAMRLGDSIEAGMVGVNRGIISDPSAPFGGVKESGLGREGGHEGIREFQETQYISIDQT